MKNKKILILAFNDGTDTRIRKIVNSINSSGFKTHVLLSFSKKKIRSSNIPFAYTQINYNYKNFLFPFSIFFFLIKYRLKGFKSIHICNEQMLIFIPYVKLLFSCSVLDIFDSLYLKLPFMNYLFPQFLLHKCVNLIVVTDLDRKSILPIYSKKKTLVIPNYPRKEEITKILSLPRKILKKDKITIGYFGSMLKKRGVEFMNTLLENNKIKIKVVCGGWCYDDYSIKFVQKKNVSYLGVINQKKVFNIIRTKVDFLIAIYPNDTLNNIYASPNKIWEAAFLGVPLIMNSEIRISKFIKKKNLGIVINSNKIDYFDLLKQMTNFKSKKISKYKYFWENSIISLINFYKNN